MVFSTHINNLKKPLGSQTGISLIELMITMLIGLILLAGVTGIFLSSQQAYRMQEASSRVQESGRFALDVIAYDARMAGYNGCGSGNVNNILDTDNSAYDPSIHSVGSGFSPPGSFSDEIAGDVLTINYMGSEGQFDVGKDSNQPPLHGEDEDGNHPQIDQGQIVMVVDADGQCEMFQNTTAQQGVVHRGSGDNVSPGNLNLGGQGYTSFNDEVEFFDLQTIRYYIAESAHDNDQRSLWRQRLFGDTTSEAEELVTGVYNMRLEYGLDTNNNQQINEYEAAGSMTNAQWDQVAAVRVHLLVYNDDNRNVMPDAVEDLPFAGGLFNPLAGDEHKMFQTFTTTIAARNRLN